MIDARLAVPAITAWLGAIAVQVLSGGLVDAMVSTAVRRTVIGWGTIAVVAACLPWILGWLPRRRPSISVVAAVAPAACLGVAVGVASAGLMVVALASDPVAGWASSRASATVQAVIGGDAVVRARTGAAIWQAGSVVEARISTSQVAARGAQVQVDLPMLLRVTSPQAQPSAVPPVGAEVRVTGRLSASRTPGNAAVLTVSDPDAVLVVTDPGIVDAVANAMRTGLRNSVAGLDPGAGALVAGLSVGDESLLPADLDQSMRDAGLSHLTAVSGGNVAIVIVAVLGLARLAGLRMRARVALCLLALAAFVILVRPQPSVLRAGVMGAVVLLGMLGGGRRRGVGVLSTTILLLVAISPSLAVSWGFGLSVAATGGLILLAPLVQERLRDWSVTRRWPPGWREAMSITLAAQLATLPLLVAMGSAVGWAAIPANLLAMPAVPAVTVAGLLAALISPVLPGLASIVASIAAVPAAWIAWVARMCSDLPAATLPWPSGWVGIGVLAVVGTLGWLAARRLRVIWPTGVPLRTRIALAGAGVTFLVALTIAPPSLRGWPPPGWILVACDVGQGDGLVVNADEGSAIVVDVGPDGDAMLRCLKDLGVDRVSAIVLTHFHADHVLGLERVLDELPVGMVYVNAVNEPREQWRWVEQVLQRTGVPSAVAQPGDVRSVGSVRWEVLWPRRVIMAGSIPNNASTVLLLQAGGIRVLLPGDIEPEAQVALMAGRAALQADVVKVPHHGSRYQDPRFAAWAGGRIALVSVGIGNDYGHPAPQTLAMWEDLGALVGRTDLDSDLAVVMSGQSLGLVTRG